MAKIARITKEYVVNFDDQWLYYNGIRDVEIDKRPLDVLEYLSSYPNTRRSQMMIGDALGYIGESAVRGYIRKLRNTHPVFKKIIQTKRGYGYYYEGEKIMDDPRFGMDVISTSFDEESSWVHLYPKLAERYWNAHQYLHIDKFDKKKRRFKQVIPFHDVYQVPVLGPAMDEKWNVKQAKGKISVIEAPNGSGKTSFLKGLVLCSLYEAFAEDAETPFYEALAAYHGLEKDSLVLYYEASELKCDRETAFDCLYESRNIVGACTREDFYSLVKQYNANGRLILLIDGYDEAEDGQQKLVKDWLIELFNDFEIGTSAVVILATRPRYMGNKIGEDEYIHNFWEILPYNTEKDYRKVMELAGKYLKHVINDEGLNLEKLCSHVFSNYYIKRMPTTPYILVSLLEDFMNNISSVHLTIDKVMSQLLDRYKKMNIFQDEARIYKELHEELAFVMLKQKHGKSGIEYDRFLHVVETCVEIVRNRYAHVNYKSISVLNDLVAEKMFTGNGLLKVTGTEIRFMISDVLSSDFCARKLARMLLDQKQLDTKAFFNILQEVKEEYRYEILTMVMVIVFNRDSYDGYFSSNLPLFELDACMEQCCRYMVDQFHNSKRTEEKEAIKKAIMLLMSNSYGEIPFTSVNNFQEEEQDVKIRKEFLDILDKTRNDEWEMLLKEIRCRFEVG